MSIERNTHFTGTYYERHFANPTPTHLTIHTPLFSYTGASVGCIILSGRLHYIVLSGQPAFDSW
jgi:hypothetical protein